MQITQIHSPNSPCRFCGAYHGPLCPAVKAYDIDKDGHVVRIEFHPPVAVPMLIHNSLMPLPMKKVDG